MGTCPSLSRLHSWGQPRSVHMQALPEPAAPSVTGGLSTHRPAGGCTRPRGAAVQTARSSGVSTAPGLAPTQSTRPSEASRVTSPFSPEQRTLDWPVLLMGTRVGSSPWASVKRHCIEPVASKCRGKAQAQPRAACFSGTHPDRVLLHHKRHRLPSEFHLSYGGEHPPPHHLLGVGYPQVPL